MHIPSLSFSIDCSVFNFQRRRLVWVMLALSWRSQCIWVTFYVSTSVVCPLLTKSMYLSYLLCINKCGLPPSDEVNVSELPSMYQQVWSATFWRSQCIWITFYVSTSLVCHLLTKAMYLSYVSCIKKFGLPPSASCPANRNVNDEECLPLVSVWKRCTSLFGNLEWCSH